MNPVDSIHPFPARMASEIALAEVAGLPPGSVVLDPMAGSGTVLRVAAERGHVGLGFDLDPLAVLMARVFTTPVDSGELRRVGHEAAEEILELHSRHLYLPWIDSDEETRSFVDFWFAKAQQSELRRLTAVLLGRTGPIADALRLALSRLIVTKDRGASLARDVSHSRPHRVRLTNDFPVLSEFHRSVEQLAKRLERQPPPGNVCVRGGDARNLCELQPSSVDAIITSPPYLNAIDYMRGHRLALVWLGYGLSELRAIRRTSIGAERKPDADTVADGGDGIACWLATADRLPTRERGMLQRYAVDMRDTMSEMSRVLKGGGRATLVVGNSCIRGVFVENARMVRGIAERVGFHTVHDRQRQLPPNRRYLPPPALRDTSALVKRMSTETVLTLVRR